MMNRLRQFKRFRAGLPLLLAVWVVGMTGSESGPVAPLFHSSFKSAADAAAADQSLVLLVFSAEWCGPCKLLKSKTLDAPEFLAQDAPLHVADVDIDANQKMARDFEVEAVPTLVLVTPEGKIIERQTGFMEVADLLAWLKTGRTRAAAGQWEGTVPGAQFNEFIKKASGADLGTIELRQLVEYLGDADPANRDQAAKLLLEQREKAVPLLIEAVGNPYLGERIGAGDLLQHLAPNVPPIDPWQSPAARSNAVAELRSWWAANGKLPMASAPVTNSFSANSVKEAIDALRGDDPARRTAAMTTLVQTGAGALPAVRDALKRAERNGDQRALGLLEDVRWTIVVPDAVEEQSGGVRNVLARGKSTERQAAATRLGGMGRNALNVLVELAGDTDPLVVENAIHALAGISGEDAIPALATLLSSGDSNLRMTAAQALGQTRNPAAIKPLLPAFSDPDEVVACAALSALEENQARESYSSTAVTLTPETIEALKHGLQDPRWRVRAAAAEVAGKLSVAKLKDDLNKLLSDNDGFVVKSALTALETLNSQPDSDQILALAKRLPSLQGDAVDALLRTESDETVKTVTKLFNDGTTDTRIAILGAFLHRGFYGYTQNDEGWKPMLAQAIAAPDARLRQTAARVLSRRTAKVQAQLVGPLLTDEDPETRRIGASLVLQILGQRKSSRNQMVFTGTTSSTTSSTNKFVANPDQVAEWHQALLQRAGTNVDLNLAAALFVTGDGQKERPILLAALNHPDTNTAEAGTEDADELSAIQAIMPKLSLPDDQPVLDKLTSTPLAFAQAVRQAKLCQPAVVDFLLTPARFKAAVEPAIGKELSAALNLVAGYDYEYENNRGWSLWSETDQAKAVVDALLTSTNAGWRAAAVFALGCRANAKDHLEVLAKAAADPDPWVRGSAARALAQAMKTRAELEKSLAPLLAETNLTVAAAAAVALLEPETRSVADLNSTLEYFEYDSVRGGRSVTHTSNEDRPLATLDGKPAFLGDVQKRLAAADAEAMATFALLLAQYGDFSGVDRLVAQAGILDNSKETETVNVLLTGIALSHDVKYLPALKRMTAAEREESSLRKILQAMKGMTGPEARQLRLEVNKKIRNAASPSAQTD